MHIVFLSHYFPPEVNAPASRTYENAKRWVKQGAEVTVITCVPNHPNGVVYPGYANRLRQWEEKEGIRILRVKTYLSANKGFFKRIINYISFMFSSILMSTQVRNVDIVASTSPQFFCGLSGYFISKLKKCPWVLEIRDLWPESIIAVGALKQGTITMVLKAIETFMYKKADHIVSVTKSFKKYIEGRGKRSDLITIVTNGADMDQFKGFKGDNPIIEQWGLQDKFVVSFIGTHGMAHGLDTVLRAAVILKDRTEIRFMLVGDGATKQNLAQKKKSLGLDNILMIGQQPKKHMPAFIAASDACMVLLCKSDLFKTVIPSKIFEIMAMERPIIHGVEGESKQIIEAANCGICIEPENEHELAAAVLKLYDNRSLCKHLSGNGRGFVKKFYNRDKLANQYLQVLNKVEQVA